MKRSRLRRRTPLPPGPGPTRRTPLRAVSPQREAERDEHDQVRAFVFHRDQLRCRLADWAGAHGVSACCGQLTVHHIRKAAQGGPYVPLNLVTLCAWHNDWLETARGAPWGKERGLVARRGDDLIVCWAKMRAAGVVAWNHAGE
jgi:hypothetical protein